MPSRLVRSLEDSLGSHRRAVVHALVAASLAALGAACGSSDAAAPESPSTIGGVGALPGTLPAASTVPATVPPTTGPLRVAPTTDDAQPAPTTSGRANAELTAVGGRVEGNRVIVLGDSIMASISDRYGDQLCDLLVPKGWAVEVDAEVGRSVEFGREVLDERAGQDFDAAVVMLGNNYGGDPQEFDRELDRLLDELAPRPVLLLNVTRFEPEQDEVNYVLTGAAKQRDDVRLLDWAARTAEDAPETQELLAGDGLHLSADGQLALATMISRALGRAPSGSEGECVGSSFRDDSRGSMPATERSGRDDDEDEGGGRNDGGSGTGAARPVVTTTAAPRAEPEPGVDEPLTTSPPAPPVDDEPTAPPPTDLPSTAAP